METIQLSKVVAWAATVFCTYISARSAAKFSKHSPRVFTILALFSLNWALLVPFYSAFAPSVLMAGFAGFLMVYVGVLLRREAKNPLISGHEPTTAHIETNVAREDRIALWLLVPLCAPSLLSIPFPSQIIETKSSFTEPIISSLITYFGYYSICSAIRLYSSKKWGWRVMTGIVVPYSIVDAAFTYRLLTSHNTDIVCTANFWVCPPTMMEPVFLYLFAILKVLLSTTFVYLVLQETFSEEDRKLSWVDKLLKLVGIL